MVNSDRCSGQVVFNILWFVVVLLFFECIDLLVNRAYFAWFPWIASTCQVLDRGISSDICTRQECSPPPGMWESLSSCPENTEVQIASLVVQLRGAVLSHGLDSNEDLETSLGAKLATADPLLEGTTDSGDVCRPGNFSGGACQQNSVAADKTDSLLVECRYQVWARVRVVKRAPGGASRARDGSELPRGTFCASRLGIQGFAEYGVEYSDWATACTLYNKLNGSDETIPCFWRDTMLTHQPRVTLSDNGFSERVWVYVHYALACFLISGSCIWFAFYTHSGFVLINLDAVLATAFVLSTIVDLSCILPLCSATLLFLLICTTLSYRDGHRAVRWTTMVFVAFYLLYAAVGSFYFMDEAVQIVGFLTRACCAFLLWILIRCVRSGRSRLEGMEGHQPLLHSPQEATESVGARLRCSDCGHGLFTIPFLDRPLSCGRCSLNAVFQTLNALSGVYSAGQRYKLKRIAENFFEVRAFNAGELADQPCGGSSSEELGTCMVCMEAPAICVLAPCGHGGLCERCARYIYFLNSRTACHMCRSEAFAVIRIDAFDSHMFLGATLDEDEEGSERGPPDF